MQLPFLHMSPKVQAMPSLQPVRSGLLPPSMQVCAPVTQEVTPFLQTLGFEVQEPPAVQATQVPAPLQTMFVPQPVPAALLPASTQVWAPVAQDVVPVLQALGLLVQEV